MIDGQLVVLNCAAYVFRFGFVELLRFHPASDYDCLLIRKSGSFVIAIGVLTVAVTSSSPYCSFVSRPGFLQGFSFFVATRIYGYC